MKLLLAKCSLVLLLILPNFSAFSQNTAKLDAAVQKQLPQAYELLKECLSVPNDAHFEEHVEMNVKWMENAFGQRGFSTERLETGGPPLLLAERKGSKSDQTVLIYLQIDGQPVDPSAWFQPDPWKPVLKEMRDGKWEIIDWSHIKGKVNPDWRVFARAASDAKVR